MSDGVIFIKIFLHDFIHIFQLFWNFFMDHVYVKFINRIEFSKKDILYLMVKADSSVSNLKDIHIKCKSSNRQNLKLGYELFSDTIAILLVDIFLGDK